MLLSLWFDFWNEEDWSGKKPPVPIIQYSGGSQGSPKKPPAEHNTYEISKAAFERKQKEIAELNAKKAETLRLAEEKEAEIQRLEKIRLQNLSDKFYQKQLFRLLAEAAALSKQSADIDIQIRAKQIEEEDIYIILLSMPFMA